MIKKKWFRISLVSLLVLVGWVLWGNTALECSIYPIYSNILPESFEGYRIAQVSDLHNAQFGADNQQLLDMLESSQPDIIVLTGDLVDSRRTNLSIALSFARNAARIAPCYYITGNHESRLSDSDYFTLESGLEDVGVSVLHQETAALQQGNDTILLIGIDDPAFAQRRKLDAPIGQLPDLSEEFHILLSHRPELIAQYAEKGFDLVLAGHTHGGQFRLPLIGGIFAPDQGFFPTYDAGLFAQDDTQMIVSRGVGSSQFPFRLNNRPEIVVAELHTAER